MTIHQIECFLEAAKTLNFTEAASRLYISQQGLSRQIASLEKELELRELTEHIDKFLAGLKEQERDIFVSRYWYMVPVNRIAEKAGFSYSKTASMLHRTRLKLGMYLRKEGLL